MKPCRVLLIPVLLALYAAAPVAGQTAVSVLAGVTSAGLKAADADDDSDGSRTGVSLGAAVTVPVVPNLGIRLGGAYVQKGGSIGVRADDIVNAFYADLKLDYIELSALAKASAPGSVGFLYLLAGPTVSFESPVYDRSDVFPRRGHGRAPVGARLFGRSLFREGLRNRSR